MILGICINYKKYPWDFYQSFHYNFIREIGGFEKYQTFIYESSRGLVDTFAWHLGTIFQYSPFPDWNPFFQFGNKPGH